MPKFTNKYFFYLQIIFSKKLENQKLFSNNQQNLTQAHFKTVTLLSKSDNTPEKQVINLFNSVQGI